MARIELMKDKETREQFSPVENARIGGMLKEMLMESGLFGMFRNPIEIVPPLIITRDEIDEIVKGFDRAIGEIQKQFLEQRY
jgi:adenosylmethionine-8-amino-7-oxononanoate aminotransferase